MERYAPEVKKEFLKEMAARERNTRIDWTKDFSLYLGIPLLCALRGLTPALLNVLDGCCELNRRQRNVAAHQLHAVTEEQIREDCCDRQGKRYSSEQLVKAFAQMLKQAYPDVCDDTLFTIYDRCEAYFLERI